MIDPKPEEADPSAKGEQKPKPDLSAYKKNLAAIQKEEEEKEEFIEAQEAKKKEYPANPAVENAEAAEAAAEERKVEAAKQALEE